MITLEKHFLYLFVVLFLQSFILKINAQVEGPSQPGGEGGGNANLAQMAGVSQATGEVAYALPVAALAEGGLQMSVSAVYTSAGYRIGDRGGMLGPGWSLDLGASLTREVRGIPDDATVGAWQKPIDVSSDAKKAEALERKRDSEYDVFRYRIGGSSGSFYVKDGRAYKVPESNDSIRVLKYGAYQSPVGFEITNTVGQKYVFGNIPVSSSILPLMSFTSFNAPFSQPDNPLIWAPASVSSTLDAFKRRYPTNYHIASISDYNGSKISFTYHVSHYEKFEHANHIAFGFIDPDNPPPPAPYTGSNKSIMRSATSLELEVRTITGFRDGEQLTFEYKDFGNWSKTRVLSNIRKNVGAGGSSMRFQYDRFKTVRTQYFTGTRPDSTSLPALTRIVPYGV